MLIKNCVDNWKKYEHSRFREINVTFANFTYALVWSIPFLITWKIINICLLSLPKNFTSEQRKDFSRMYFCLLNLNQIAKIAYVLDLRKIIKWRTIDFYYTYGNIPSIMIFLWYFYQHQHTALTFPSKVKFNFELNDLLSQNMPHWN